MRLSAKIIIGLVLLATTGALHAEEPWQKYGMILPEMVADHRQELGLTADQEAKIRGSLSDAFLEADKLGTAMTEQQQKFDEVMSRPNVSEEDASAALAKSLEADAAMEKLQLKALLALRDQLTPEQQAKARELPAIDSAETAKIKARIDEKGGRLRKAFEAVGFEPAALEARGRVIEQLGREGMFATAEWVLDQLIADTGLDEPVVNVAIDFGKFDPGDTDLSALQDRYAAVQEKAKSVISLPELRKVMKARDEFEKARKAEDVMRVGRVLTYAEGLLKSK
jgi:Spy/CpxP family protein refolding chaperone